MISKKLPSSFNGMAPLTLVQLETLVGRFYRTECNRKCALAASKNWLKPAGIAGTSFLGGSKVLNFRGVLEFAQGDFCSLT